MKKDIKHKSLANTELTDKEKEELRQRILTFKATNPSNFGDALEWQIKEREDRDLPFHILDK